MAKFLNSSATTYHLEELIRNARTRLVLVTPRLKFSGRAKELVAEKSSVEVRIIYGRCDLQPDDIGWLRQLAFVRTHFCRSLTAKCYLNEEQCIVTSLDLFDFGQITNDEMGVLISRSTDPELYDEAAEEAQRILRASDEVRISVDKVARTAPADYTSAAGVKMSTHRLAKKLGLKTHELLDGLQRLGAIEVAAGQKQLTAHGVKLGGEFRSSARFGDYFVWPENFEVSDIAPTTGRR